MMVLLAIYHMGNLPSIPAWSINPSSSYFLVLCFTEQGIVSPLKEGYVESILFKTLPTLGQGWEMKLVSWVWMNWTQILNIKDSNSLDATWRVYEDLSIKTHILLMLLEDVNRKSRLEWNLKNQDFKKFQEMWENHVTETRSVRSWTIFQQDNAELKKEGFQNVYWSHCWNSLGLLLF